MCEILVSKIVVCAMPYVLVPVFLRRDVIDLDDCVPEIFVMGAFRGCLFCISVSIMFFCLRCRARPPKGVQCLPGHTLGTGRKCKPGPRPTPETRVPQHANFAGGSNPAWTQKWGDMGARKGSPASPPPNKNSPHAGRPRRHQSDREPRKDKKLPRTAYAVQLTQETAQLGEDKNCPKTNAAWPQRATAQLGIDQENIRRARTARKVRRAAGNQKLSRDQRGMTPKGDCAAQERPRTKPDGHEWSAKAAAPPENKKITPYGSRGESRSLGPCQKLSPHSGERITANKGDRAAWGRQKLWPPQYPN